MTTLLLPPSGAAPRDVATALNLALKGKLNSTGNVTLAASTGSTVVKDVLVGTNSVVLLFPQTAHAAAEIGNGTIYAAPGNYVNATSFTLTHANNAQTDRTFGYCLLG